MPDDPHHPLLESHEHTHSLMPLPITSSFTSICFLSGMAARVSSAVITSPLDVLKVRLQFQNRQHTHHLSTNAVQAAKHIFQKEGISSFYRGLPVRLLYITPAAAFNFFFYEQFHALFQEYLHSATSSSSTPNSSSNSITSTLNHPRLFLPLAIGGICRIIGIGIRIPFDVVRQRMQIMNALKHVQMYKDNLVTSRPIGYYHGNLDAFRTIIRQEGVKTLWNGFTITILRDVPFTMLYFISYEVAKTAQRRVMKSWRNKNKPSNDNTTDSNSASSTTASATTSSTSSSSSSSSSTSSSSSPASPRASHSTRYFTSGALAAAVAVVGTHPIDTIKVKLQTQGSTGVIQYSGIVDCATQVWRHDGWRGFYRGVGPRLFYNCPTAAITFTLYELFKRKLETHFNVRTPHHASHQHHK